MEITDMLLTMGKEHGRTGQALTPKGVTVHYVGNPGSTAASNRNWFENGANGAHTSAHYVIGLKGEILRLVPENERAQHAGKSYGKQWDEQVKTNNATYIGIECCHPDDSGKFNEKTYAALIELCADICKRRGFDPVKQAVRHYDIAGKDCPTYYVKHTAMWSQVVVDIRNAMGGEPSQKTVKVSLDGVPCVVKADNIGGSWYITLNDLKGLQIRLSDALVSAGYTCSWDAATETVVAVKK